MTEKLEKMLKNSKKNCWQNLGIMLI